jgi:hypothetical protein
LVFALRERYQLRACENRLLRRIFGQKRAEVTGSWRKFHNKKFQKFYSPPDIMMIKSGRVKWAGYVVCTRESRKACTVWLENVKGREHSED